MTSALWSKQLLASLCGVVLFAAACGKIDSPTPAAKSSSVSAPEIVKPIRIGMKKCLSIERYQYKAALVVHWTTWSGPCRKYAPRLSQLQDNYGDELGVFAFFREDESTVRQYYDRNRSKIRFQVALGGGNDWAKSKNTDSQSSFPYAFLIVKGKLVWQGDPRDPALEAELERLVPKRPTARAK